MEQPRNVKIENVELNWAKLDKPVSPFGTEQYELQIATTDAEKAEELRANHLNVKEKDGKFVVSLKRKAKKANGEDNGPVRVVDANLRDIENKRSIGNGSIGNVILFQYPYDNMGRKGIGSSLTAVQITEFVEFKGTDGVDFDVVGESATGDNPEAAVEMF